MWGAASDFAFLEERAEVISATDDGSAEEGIAVYHPGGFHPVHLGDIFANGGYEVLRKLGYGRYSTVWLVRNHR